MGKLSDSDIKTRLGDLPGWTFENNALRRQFTCKSFPDAVSFVMRLAFSAEAADHHPDLLLNFKRVTVTWSTHSDGGVTEKDFSGAKQADLLSHAFI